MNEYERQLNKKFDDLLNSREPFTLARVGDNIAFTILYGQSSDKYSGIITRQVSDNEFRVVRAGDTKEFIVKQLGKDEFVTSIP